MTLAAVRARRRRDAPRAGCCCASSARRRGSRARARTRRSPSTGLEAGRIAPRRRPGGHEGPARRLPGAPARPARRRRRRRRARLSARRAEAAAQAAATGRSSPPATPRTAARRGARRARRRVRRAGAAAAAATTPPSAPARAAVDAALDGLHRRAHRRGAGAPRQQLLQFLALVPVEYGRGVKGTRVTLDFEIQEAVAFHTGAAAAFADLQDQLAKRDPARTAAVADGSPSSARSSRGHERTEGVAAVEEVEARRTAIEARSAATMPGRLEGAHRRVRLRPHRADARPHGGRGRRRRVPSRPSRRGWRPTRSSSSARSGG